jgi:hypothetical protein
LKTPFGSTTGSLVHGTGGQTASDTNANSYPDDGKEW